MMSYTDVVLLESICGQTKDKRSIVRSRLLDFVGHLQVQVQVMTFLSPHDGREDGEPVILSAIHLLAIALHTSTLVLHAERPAGAS